MDTCEGWRFAVVDDGFLAREHQPHWPPRLHGHQGQHALVDHVLLAAEAATNGAHDEPHLVDRLGQNARQHVPVMRDVLVGGEDRHHAVVVDIGEPGLGLQVGMLDGLRGVVVLDDEIARRQRRLGVAFADGMCLVTLSGAYSCTIGAPAIIAKSGSKIAGRAAYTTLILSRARLAASSLSAATRRHRLTDVAHLAAGHHRLIVDETPKLSTPGTSALVMTASTPSADWGLRGVDRNNGRVRVRRAQNGDVQHPGHHHVAGVFERAGHLRRRIDAADIGADIQAVVR